MVAQLVCCHAPRGAYVLVPMPLVPLMPQVFGDAAEDGASMLTPARLLLRDMEEQAVARIGPLLPN